MGLANISSWSLDQVFELLVAQFQRHGLAIIKVLILECPSVQVQCRFNQDLSCSLLEELHFGLAKVEHIIVILLTFALRILLLLTRLVFSRLLVIGCHFILTGLLVHVLLTVFKGHDLLL